VGHPHTSKETPNSHTNQVEPEQSREKKEKWKKKKRVSINKSACTAAQGEWRAAAPLRALC